MAFSYNKLRGRIVEVYGSMEAFADAIGMHRVSVSQRINHKVEWNSSEIKMAIKALGLTDEDIPIYFFSEESSEIRFL